ncbi:MAG: DctP family TRAP transporter solute-binding subunit, partial [Magnetococcales bacterium]|nr:DctP family TRAP transporter solute-binding subunit [Magnetococcales bacterium]
MKEKQIIVVLSVALVLILSILAIRIHHRTNIENATKNNILKPNKLRLGLNIPEGTALHAAAKLFSKRVFEKSKGRINVTVHPNQELGNDNQMLEMARRGELAMILTPTAKLSTAVPAMQVMDLPFFFNSRNELYMALDGEFGAKLLSKLEGIGLRGVTIWENGFKHFTANKPLHSPKEFKNLKMRIMKSRIIQEQFEALGASTLPVDFHSTKQALADGIVDGQENPLAAIVSMDFHTVQSNLTLSNHAYLGYVFSISKKRLNDISLIDQRLLLETAKEITNWEREETQRREEVFLVTIKKSNVQISQLTQAEKNILRKKLSHIPRKFESMLGADIISLAEELNILQQANNTASSPILIGLDADLSVVNSQAALAIKQGAKLAIHEINSSGGVLGRKKKKIARYYQNIQERSRNNLKFFNSMNNFIGKKKKKKSQIIK